MKSLKINIPNGFVIDKFDETTGEVSFKPTPKLITERIKTFEDVLLEINTDQTHFDSLCVGLSADEIAYKKIKLIAKVLNEGWTPDWTNSNETKYYPWFEMGSPSGGGFSCYDCARWNSFSGVGSRLCYKSRDLAIYAGKHFTDIYKDFLTLNK
jgi:hypothetical protein